MTPEQFLATLKKDGPQPAYLFLGPEAFERERCRKAIFALIQIGSRFLAADDINIPVEPVFFDGHWLRRCAAGRP